MKKLSFLLLITVLFFSCEVKDNNNRHSTGSEKKDTAEYYKRAIKLMMQSDTERDSILQAVALLDSAILIDSENVRAYLLKQTFQMRLGEYENGLQTARILEKIKPGDPDLTSRKGLLYLMEGNEDKARIAFRQADSLWSLMLDTISSNNDWGLFSTLWDKAANLKLAGQEEKADNTYKRILNDPAFHNEKFAEMKDVIDSVFLHQTSKEFYNYITQGLKKVKN